MLVKDLAAVRTESLLTNSLLHVGSDFNRSGHGL